MANKVVFGLKNVHYAIWTPPAGSTPGSFATPVAVPGAVNLSLTREGDENKFYADDVVYFSTETNAGYTADLELAYAPISMLKALAGYIEDANHIILEDSDAVPTQFALLYEVTSNDSNDRFVFYNCTLSRPENEASTKTDSTEPNTQKLSLVIAPLTLPYGTNATKNFVKGYVSNSGDMVTKYNAWFSAVQMPTAPSV